MDLRHAVIVPLKDFTTAKSRLRHGTRLDVGTVVRALAANVLAECSPHPTFVVTESDDVEEFARVLGYGVLRSPIGGLNPALQWAYATLSPVFSRVTIVQGDLRDPAGVGELPITGDVVIVPDHRGQGTAVLSVPTGTSYRFHFGVGSASAHEREARAQRLTSIVHAPSPWSVDVDEASDLVAPVSTSEGATPPRSC